MSKVRGGQVFVEIGADPKKFFAALTKLNGQIGKLGASMQNVGAKMTAIGVGLGVPIGLAVRQFAAFDDAIRATAAVSQASGRELQMLNDKARDLGATTSFTAIQVANLMTELGRAGFRPDEINAMTGAVLDLARATGTDATLASGIMAATLRQFGLGATEAARAADVLTKTANSTFNTVEGLGESLKYAGPVAKSLGLSLEDTTAILGVLGNVGIQGSEAGTALRRLGVISAASGDKLKQLFNVDNTDAAGNLKPLVQILDEINTATSSMPVAERTKRMAEAFGLLGITSANVLSSTAGGVTALAAELRNAEGTAAKAAKEMDAGLGGAFRIAISAIEGTALALGDALAPSLIAALNGVIDVATGLTTFVKANQELIVSVAKGIALFTAVGGSLIGLGATLKLVSFSMGGLVSAASLVVMPLASIITTVVGLVASFASATAGVLAYSAASVAAAVASGTAWALANAPLVALVGILGALGAAFVGMLGGLQGITDGIGNGLASAVRQSTSLFFELGEIAQTAIDGIYNAIVGGDLKGAMEIAMAGVVAAFAKGTSNLLKTLDLTWADIQNTFDAMQAFAKQPLMMFEAIKDPFVEADRKALQERQAERLAKADARATEREGKANQSNNALNTKVRNSRNKRAQHEHFTDLLKNIEGVSSLSALRDLYDEFDTLSQNGRLTSSQASALETALEDAQERVSKSSSGGGSSPSQQIAAGAGAAGADAATSKAEVAGTFSSVNLGGMGFGSSLGERQLKALETIADNTSGLHESLVGE